MLFAPSFKVTSVHARARTDSWTIFLNRFNRITEKIHLKTTVRSDTTVMSTAGTCHTKYYSYGQVSIDVFTVSSHLYVHKPRDVGRLHSGESLTHILAVTIYQELFLWTCGRSIWITATLQQPSVVHFHEEPVHLGQTRRKTGPLGVALVLLSTFDQLEEPEQEQREADPRRK